MTLPVSKLDPITDTDTDTESETVSVSDDAKSGFASLKAYLPNTDGASYGLENYRELISMGYTASDIEEAMRRLTAALRADYPDRPAKYFPHAEKLLDPKNPSGVMRFLPKTAPLALPDNRKLLFFALTKADRETMLFVERLNDDVINARDEDEKKAAAKRRNSWLNDNRERLLALWRQEHSADRR